MRRIRIAALRHAAALAAVGALTMAARSAHINPATVGFVFLVAVLVVSAYWGLLYAVVMAIASAAAFNYYFLPPVGTFVIADPHNWVALIAFVATALIASNLSERARREAEEATRRRTEAERLYALSQALLRPEDVPELYAHLPRMIVEAFGANGAVLLMWPDEVYRSAEALGYDEPSLRDAGQQGQRTASGEQMSLPLRMRGQTVGAVAVIGPRLSNETYEALGSLIGLAMERTHAIEELARNQASQENERLRTALLDSVSHEFRTPLTGIKASVTGLLSSADLDPEQRKELLTIIDEESDRLNRLVAQAAEMAQLEAGDFQLELTACDVREIAEAAVSRARKWLDRRRVEVSVADRTPRVLADANRIRDVLAQLLENAGKYSEPETLIRVAGEQQGDRVLVRVSDTGAGIEESEQSRIFEKFFRGRRMRYKARGTGMGLAVAKVVVEAHRGNISVMSRPGIGSVFTVVLPVARETISDADAAKARSEMRGS